MIFRIHGYRIEYKDILNSAEASSSSFCIFESLNKREAKLSCSFAMCISNVLFGIGKY